MISMIIVVMARTVRLPVIAIIILFFFLKEGKGSKAVFFRRQQSKRRPCDSTIKSPRQDHCPGGTRAQGCEMRVL